MTTPEKQEYQRDWYQKNKDRVSSNTKSWRLNNIDKVKKQTQAYRLANPDKAAKWGKNARAKVRLDRPWVRLLRSTRASAKSRGLSYELDEEWFRARWTGVCDVTGLRFQINSGSRHGPCARSASVDRIDPEKGYLRDNCRIILYGVNMLKWTGTDDEMRMIARAIISKEGEHYFDTKC